VDPGLYVTFFTEGEPVDGELPPVGPLEHVVVRDGSLLADRKNDQHADHFGGGLRWIEAEHELRRATGKDPGGVKRPDLRVGAPEGVYLRFVSFGADAEHDPIPELGPYAVVVVGRRGVEADGDTLATHTGSDQKLWELTSVGGSTFVGLIRPDIAFRTRSTAYHSEVKPFRREAQPVTAPSRPAAVALTGAVQESQPQQALEDPGLSLRDRIGSEPSTTRSGYLVGEPDEREWGGAAWRLRYLIIGALVVLIVAFSVPSIRSLFTTGGPISDTVTVGTLVTSNGWTYNVGSVRRLAQIGGSQANGTYMVVRIATTNRGPTGAQLTPRNFTLIAATGERYAAQSATSGVYSSTGNPDSAYEWPTDFPIGRAIALSVIFEVNPSISGTQLLISDVPTTRIRLD
jgi:hypothetical protein